jgi:hypothetical protein
MLADVRKQAQWAQLHATIVFRCFLTFVPMLCDAIDAGGSWLMKPGQVRDCQDFYVNLTSRASMSDDLSPAHTA